MFGCIRVPLPRLVRLLRLRLPFTVVYLLPRYGFPRSCTLYVWFTALPLPVVTRLGSVCFAVRGLVLLRLYVLFARRWLVWFVHLHCYAVGSFVCHVGSSRLGLRLFGFGGCYQRARCPLRFRAALRLDVPVVLRCSGRFRAVAVTPGFPRFARVLFTVSPFLLRATFGFFAFPFRLFTARSRLPLLVYVLCWFALLRLPLRVITRWFF